MLIAEQDVIVRHPLLEVDGGITLMCTIRTHDENVLCSIPPVHILPDARNRYELEIKKRAAEESKGDQRMIEAAILGIREGELSLRRVAWAFLRKHSRQDLVREDWPGGQIPLTIDSMNEVLGQFAREHSAVACRG